jgi:2-polyprenyl-3-methyl-5-hydroxy-6-metoxy-1,4-benzoquinol methylase
MSRTSYENYGRRARELQDPTQMAARYQIQKDGERRIFHDVVDKLRLGPNDVLLDLGCNVGNLLIPLSFLVREVVGIDHPSCICRLQERFDGSNVKLSAGNFLDLVVQEKFDKILCYSVLHYLTDSKEVLEFMDKALSLLKPGGNALFGDIPNRSLKQRFLGSDAGSEFVREWERLKESHSKKDSDYDGTLTPDTDLVQFDDALILRILNRYRGEGFHSYALPQPPDLPFGNTREDVLVTKFA